VNKLTQKAHSNEVKLESEVKPAVKHQVEQFDLNLVEAKSLKAWAKA
jgi:hypothetical protein